jgi:CheY-like chemotaxis protein
MHIRIIHWKSDEIREQIKRLQNAGHCVDSEIPAGQKLLKSLSQILPDVILIDLSRLPSQGRDLALYLRKNKATRMVPLVFINGKNEIQRDIKNYLPDVFFTDWRHLDSVLKQVVSSPIKTVRVPQSLFEPYKNRKLTQKLGINPGFITAECNP